MQPPRGGGTPPRGAAAAPSVGAGARAAAHHHGDRPRAASPPLAGSAGARPPARRGSERTREGAAGRWALTKGLELGRLRRAENGCQRRLGGGKALSAPRRRARLYAAPPPPASPASAARASRCTTAQSACTRPRRTRPRTRAPAGSCSGRRRGAASAARVKDVLARARAPASGAAAAAAAAGAPRARAPRTHGSSRRSRWLSGGEGPVSCWYSDDEAWRRAHPPRVAAAHATRCAVNARRGSAAMAAGARDAGAPRRDARVMRRLLFAPASRACVQRCSPLVPRIRTPTPGPRQASPALGHGGFHVRAPPHRRRGAAARG